MRGIIMLMFVSEFLKNNKQGRRVGSSLKQLVCVWKKKSITVSNRIDNHRPIRNFFFTR